MTRDPLEPQPMTPDQIADLVERARAADEAMAQRGTRALIAARAGIRQRIAERKAARKAR